MSSLAALAAGSRGKWVRRGRGALILAAIAAAVGASVGCEGLQQLAAPEVPLWVHHPGAAVTILWRQELGVPAREGHEAYERGRPEIDAVHRRVFVGTSDHGLYCLGAVDGARIWRYETAGAVQTEPLYDAARDAVYFGSNDGALYSVRASDGKLRWRFDTSAEIRRRPVLHDGTLFVTNANDTLLAIDPDQGTMRWFRHRTPAFGMEMAGHAGPAVYGDKVFTAFSDGVVMAYATGDGSPRWAPVDLTADTEQARVGEELRYLDVDTTPVVTTSGNDAIVIVASYEGGVFALDADNGMRVWSNEGASGITELVLWTWPAAPQPERGAASAAGLDQPVTTEPPGAAQVAVARAAGASAVHRVLLGSSSLSGLWGFDPEDGRELWRRDLPSGGLTAAEPVAGAALVGTTRYGMFLIEPLTGGVLDGIHSGAAFAATPAAHGTRAFVLSNEGVLLGLHIQPPKGVAAPSEVSGLDELFGWSG